MSRIELESERDDLSQTHRGTWNGFCPPPRNSIMWSSAKWTRPSPSGTRQASYRSVG
jgi:hypothetical protein